jgi:RNA polymerase sigma-70 factor (ECF subfamily)
MRRHNTRIYRAARAILRDDRDAEDVMQQAYVNAYAHLRQFDRRASFATWLTKIAVHEAIARARKQRRYTALETDTMPMETLMPPSSSPDPERQTLTRELGALLEAAIDRLADGYREVFVLREIEGMSTADTAEALAVSDDVVKTRLSRAAGDAEARSVRTRWPRGRQRVRLPSVALRSGRQRCTRPDLNWPLASSL